MLYFCIMIFAKSHFRNHSSRHFLSRADVYLKTLIPFNFFWFQRKWALRSPGFKYKLLFPLLSLGPCLLMFSNCERAFSALATKLRGLRWKLHIWEKSRITLKLQDSLTTKCKEPLIWDQITVESASAEGKHRQRTSIIHRDLAAPSNTWRGCKRAGEGLFPRALNTGGWLQTERGLDSIRKKSLTERHWHRGSRKAGDAPPLELGKARLDGPWETWSRGRCPCPRQEWVSDNLQFKNSSVTVNNETWLRKKSDFCLPSPVASRPAGWSKCWNKGT